MCDIKQWHVERVSSEEYKKVVNDRKVFFNEPDFCELNKDKVDEVYYLIIMKDNSPRFGVILGRMSTQGKSPFSAPYSYPVGLYINGILGYDAALEALEDYCIKEKMENLEFVFPPIQFDEHELAAWISAMFRKQYDIINIDLNYSLDLCRLNCNSYEQLITSKARKHLRKAIKSEVTVMECFNEEEFKDAYDIIKLNHDVKHRPTRMTFEQLLNTVKLTEYRAFVAQINEVKIAAMIYYKINNDIVQCIYSGLLPGYENSGAMNFLSWYAIKYFGDLGFKVIDRAIATEDSIPNYGLCDFKESIGCKRSLKYTFYKKLGGRESKNVVALKHFLDS